MFGEVGIWVGKARNYSEHKTYQIPKHKLTGNLAPEKQQKRLTVSIRKKILLFIYPNSEFRLMVCTIRRNSERDNLLFLGNTINNVLKEI